MKTVTAGLLMLLLIITPHCGDRTGQKTKTYQSPGAYYTVRIPERFTPQSLPAAEDADSPVKILEQIEFSVPEPGYIFRIGVTENPENIDPIQYSRVMLFLWDQKGVKVKEQQNMTINGETWITFLVREPDGNWNFNANLVKPGHIIIVGWTTNSFANHKKFTPRLKKILRTITTA